MSKDHNKDIDKILRILDLLGSKEPHKKYEEKGSKNENQRFIDFLNQEILDDGSNEMEEEAVEGMPLEEYLNYFSLKKLLVALIVSLSVSEAIDVETLIMVLQDIAELE